MDNKTLYNLFQSQSFDSDKISTLNNIKHCITTQLTLNQLNLLMSLFSFDDGKHTCLQIFAQNNLINYVASLPNDISLILNNFSFGDGKLKALRCIDKCLSNIQMEHMSKILNVFSFDSDKSKALKIIIHSSYCPNLSQNDLCEIISKFSYDDTYEQNCKIFEIPKELQTLYISNAKQSNSSVTTFGGRLMSLLGFFNCSYSYSESTIISNGIKTTTITKNGVTTRTAESI